jgi:hypothetical protein
MDRSESGNTNRSGRARKQHTNQIRLARHAGLRKNLLQMRTCRVVGNFVLASVRLQILSSHQPSSQTGLLVCQAIDLLQQIVRRGKSMIGIRAENNQCGTGLKTRRRVVNGCDHDRERGARPDSRQSEDAADSRGAVSTAACGRRQGMLQPQDQSSFRGSAHWDQKRVPRHLLQVCGQSTTRDNIACMPTGTFATAVRKIGVHRSPSMPIPRSH